MQRTYGFTIVELLIVIVVIAILAALSYVGYTSMSNRAHDSAVQSDLRNISNKISLYLAEHEQLPVSETQLTSLGLAVSRSAYEIGTGIHFNPVSPERTDVYNLLYCRSATSNDFSLIGGSKSGKTFQFAAGSVGPFNGAVPGPAHIMCEDSGVVTSDGSGRTWFHSRGEWQPFVTH